MINSVKRVLLMSAVATAPLTSVAVAGTYDPAQEDLNSETRSALQAMQLPSREELSPELLERRTKFLASADANDDGILTKGELEAELSKQFNRMDRNGDSVVNMTDAPRLAKRKFEAKLGPVIARNDVNADGSMSYDEFASGPLSRFAALDGDKTGAVDLNALAADRQGV